MHRYLIPLLISAAVIIAGCSSPSTRKAGGYYKDDGPGSDIPANIDRIADAIPRIEPLASGANRPYTVLGKSYVPAADPDHVYKARGVASWYGKKFHGNSTSIGETYDMYAMTAAHPTMPLPSYARVTSAVNGRTVIVRVNDRGPFHSDRIIDLSYTAGHKLGLIGGGSGEVIVERILPAEIRLAQSRGTIITASGNAARQDEATVASMPLPASTLMMSELTPATHAAASPSAVTPMPASAGGLYLQMGAFSQPTNAQALVQRINSQLQGTPDASLAIVQQSGPFYRVRLGPYTDRDTALNMAQRIADQTGITPSLATH